MAIALVIGVLALVIGVVYLTAGDRRVTSQAQFPPATVDPEAAAAPSQEGAMDDQRLSGIGEENALAVLVTARERLPFRAYTPGYVPESLPLYRTDMITIGPSYDEAVLELYYSEPPGQSSDSAVHIYQTNQEGIEPSQPLAKVLTEGQVEIEGVTWQFWLLDQPHFDVYVLEATLTDGVFLSADIRVTDGLTEEAAAEGLQRFIASALEPI
jgi:hypothetical protein